MLYILNGVISVILRLFIVKEDWLFLGGQEGWENIVANQIIISLMAYYLAGLIEAQNSAIIVPTSERSKKGQLNYPSPSAPAVPSGSTGGTLVI
jgi:hypothetical protein